MEENDNYFFGSRFGNSMPYSQYTTKEKDVVVHYSGDPLEICQTCSKFLKCKEECLSDEGIQPPKHFEKAFELDKEKMFEDYINSRYYTKDYEYTKYYNEFRIL